MYGGPTITGHRVKRSHRKSRLGCVVCKQRRVKCDETKPFCLQCQRRGIDCHYTAPASHVTASCQRLNGSPVSPHCLTPPSDDSASPISECPVPQISETELATRYFSHTAATLVQGNTSNSSYHLWFVLVPSYAHALQSVKSGMLTLAALHAHFDTTLSPEAREQHLLAAHFHGTELFRECSTQMECSMNTQCNGAIISAWMICFTAFALFRYNRESGCDLTDESSWTWVHMIRGLHVIKTEIKGRRGNAAEELIHPILAEYIARTHLIDLKSQENYNHDVSSRIPEGLGFDMAALRIVLSTSDQRLTALEVALREESHLDPTEAESLLSGICQLRNVARNIESGQISNSDRSVCIWAARISRGYVDMLIPCNPLALIIYSHWLLLVVTLHGLWYVGEMGREGIRDVKKRIESDCTLLSLRWKTLFEWPSNILAEIDALSKTPKSALWTS